MRITTKVIVKNNIGHQSLQTAKKVVQVYKRQRKGIENTKDAHVYTGIYTDRKTNKLCEVYTRH